MTTRDKLQVCVCVCVCVCVKVRVFARIYEQECECLLVEENKKLEFVCAVCFDECRIDALRIATPCGHGFCEDCTVQSCVLSVPSDPAVKSCPTCRGHVTAVLQPFF